MPQIPDTLSTTPPDFKASVSTNYDTMRESIGPLIASEEISIHPIPPLPSLSEGLLALSSAYRLWQQQGWQPEVVFVPRNLSDKTWQDLLCGHTIEARGFSAGFVQRAPLPEASPTGSPKRPDQGWYTAIISSASEPEITNVSPNGRLGPNSRIVQKLAELPHIDDALPVDEVVAKVRPSQDIYLALQLSRLACGMQPVDTKTWTIGQERQVRGSETQNRYFYWREDRAGSDWIRDKFSGDAVGIRPTASTML